MCSGKGHLDGLNNVNRRTYGKGIATTCIVVNSEVASLINTNVIRCLILGANNTPLCGIKVKEGVSIVFTTHVGASAIAGKVVFQNKSFCNNFALATDYFEGYFNLNRLFYYESIGVVFNFYNSAIYVEIIKFITSIGGYGNGCAGAVSDKAFNVCSNATICAFFNCYGVIYAIKGGFFKLDSTIIVLDRTAYGNNVAYY